MTEDLIDRISALAEDAARGATRPEAAASLQDTLARLRGPIRLAFSGRVKAGKSTLLNALIGEELAPTDAGECTRIVTWYRYSDRPYALLFPLAGEPVECTYRRAAGALHVDLGGRDASAVDHLEVGWPSSRLRDVVLIDTPGISSISADVSARTHRVMSGEAGRVPVADAVLYLLRHAHSADLRFLEAFHDDDVAEGTPVNTIGVLSRADEMGCARLDAMTVAARVAARYQTDPRLHRLCPVVVPVNGLLGHAAATLREDEYAVLAGVAAAAESQVAGLLLTADRFGRAESDAAVPAARRLELLDRFGLFGVRLSVELIRRRTVTDSSALSSRLAEASGLDRLREVVRQQFDARARVLKARSAVAALRESIQRGDCHDGPALMRRLEEITAGAHQFEEIRVLLELRAGELALPEDREARLDLLMGGSGHDTATRLGLPEGAPPGQVREAAFEALSLWQAVERHPMSTRAARRAAQAATRTLEGILASTPG